MMKYIHQTENWTQFVRDEARINTVLCQLNRSVGFLAGRLQNFGFNVDSLMLDTYTQDVVYSSEIEGVELNSEQVRSSVARKLGVDIPKAVDSSHYIDGVVEVMLDATLNFAQPLSHQRLWGWHAALFPTGYSGQFPIKVVQYRTTEMKVVSGMFGRERVHYIAPSPEVVTSEMDIFLAWFNKKHGNLSPYIKSAIAHLWFVCIHPFEDGNGRIGRAIADMCLSQAENNGQRFFSVSKQINKDKKHYYKALEMAQHKNSDITEWIEWYLHCLCKAIENTCENIDQVAAKTAFWQRHAQAVISERQKRVLNHYLDGYDGLLTVKNWAKIAKCSVDTAARDIKDLENKCILQADPARQRNVVYTMLK